MSNPIPLYFRVSELLGASYVPVNLLTGLNVSGGSPTDAAPTINAITSAASATAPVILDWDIGVAMMQPLYIPNGHVSVFGRGWDTGIFTMNNATCHSISTQTGWQGNGAYIAADPGGTAPSQAAKNIVIKDIFINGNRGSLVLTTTGNTTSTSNQLTSLASTTGLAVGNSISGTGIPMGTTILSIAGSTVTMSNNATATGTGVSVTFNTGNSATGNLEGITSTSGGYNAIIWMHGINLVSATDVVIDNVYTYNTPSYHHFLSNISNFEVKGCNFDGTATTSNLNIDGVHIDGPASNFRIHHNTFNQLTDDNVALNAPEGYGGNIQFWEVDSNVHVAAQSFFRTYTKRGAATQYFVTDGAISNEVGTLTVGPVGIAAVAISLSLDSPGGTSMSANAIDRIVVSNVQAYATNNSCFFLRFNDSIGAVLFTNCKFRAVNNPWWAYNDGTQTGLPTVGSFSFLNCEIYQDTALGSPAGIGSNVAMTIQNLDWDVQVHNTPGSAFSQWLYVVDPTNLAISNLAVRRLDPTHWAALINGSTWTNLPKINGAGLVESGFQIPDAQIPNGTFYISNTSPNAGKVCLKNTSGTVVPIG